LPIRRCRSLDCCRFDSERPRRRKHALIVGRKLDGLAAGAQEFDRRQMQGIESPHRHREWLDGASEHGRRQLDQGQATNQLPRMVTVR